MAYIVDLVDKQTLSKVGELTIVNEPSINEEINAGYTFDFEVHYLDKNLLSKNVLIKADNQYFQIAKIIKNRDDSISLSVSCEHVSYELIDYHDFVEEYEENAQNMISSILANTRFNLTSCISTDALYYKPSSTEIRQRLIDIANLFGGELVFDNFNVSLVHQRGSNKGLEIALGVNLRGVTEEIDYIDNKTAYEVDLVDLSKVAGYELDFSSAEIGDTIRIKDSMLGIDTTERIISINYNPFKKALPTITVGDYIRDLTEYFKDEEDEETEEDDIKSLFKQFKIGNIDMLKSATDETNTVLNYIENKYEKGIEVSGNYNSLKGELVGIIAEANSNSHKLSVVQSKLNESGLLTAIITEITSPTQLSSVVINDNENVTLVLSNKSLSYYRENPEAVQNAFIKAIGICISFDNNDAVFLEKFSIGKLSLLGMENNDVTEVIEQFVSNQSTSPLAPSTIEIDKFLKGLDVVPTEEYSKWHLTLIHSVEGETEGSWSHTIRDLPITDYANFKVTTHKKDSVIVVISNEPFSKILDGTSSSDLYYRAFGGTFVYEEKPREITDYFDSFAIQDVDLLSIASDETPNVINYIKGDMSDVVASSIHTTSEQLTGLFAKLNSDYSDYHLTVLDYTDDDGTTNFQVVSYSTSLDSWKYPNSDKGTRSVVLVLSEDSFSSLDATNIDGKFIVAFGTKVEQNFKGIVTIKNKDLDGMIISIQEKEYDEIGTYEIEADEIDGYELVSESPMIVELTLENYEVIVEFTYERTGSHNGYTLEFGSAPLGATVNFMFSDAEGYDSVESIVPGVMGGSPVQFRFSATPIKNPSTGKYIGINVQSGASGASSTLTIQAVCYKGSDSM